MKKLSINNNVLKFLLTSAVVYAGITVLNVSFDLDQVYSEYAVRLGNWLSGSFISPNKVEFEFLNSGDLNTKIKVTENDSLLSQKWDFILMGYRPTVIMLTLMFSLLVPIKKRLLNLILGLVLISLWVYFLTYVGVQYTHIEGCRAINLSVGETRTYIINVLFKYIVRNGSFSFIIPAIIWMGLIFINRDWKVFLNES
jgi:hypothetical protein